MTLQKGICENKGCGKEYEYEYNPKYPRKYCPECSAIKKAEYEGRQPENKINKELMEEKVEVVRPGEIKAPTGEYQSLVYNKTLCANSYEVGSAGNRFKIYFEDVKELQAKLKELKEAGLYMSEEPTEEAFE